jgi:hypothetical protein
MSSEVLLDELERRWQWGTKMLAEIRETRRSDILKDFSGITADEAIATVSLLRKVHAKDWMPSIPVIQEALSVARKGHAKPAAKRSEAEQWQAAEDAALRMIHGRAIAQEAWDGGWFGFLVTCCRDKGRLAAGAEINVLRREGQSWQREMREPMTPQMHALAQSMQARLERQAMSCGVAISVEAP